MRTLPAEVDVAVVGAGAAGIGALRRLAAAGGLSVLGLEARDRIGGRVHTVAPAGFALDRGAEWLHSADINPLSPIAECLGFSVHRRRPHWTARLQRSGETPEAEADWLAFRESQGQARREAAAELEDRSLASVLPPDGRWNRLLDATSTWGNGAELDRVSVKDYVRYDDSSTDINWRLGEGYGRLFERLADALPVALATPVSRIDHGGPTLRLETARGAISARRVVIAVPASIIAGDILCFTPALPDKVEAAAGLPLGVDNKLFIGLDEAAGLEPDIFLVGSTQRRETMNYQVRPMGRPESIAFSAAVLQRPWNARGRQRCSRLPPRNSRACSAATSANTSHRLPRPPGLPIHGRAAPIPMPGRGMPTTARALPHRLTAGCFLPVRRPRRISFRPRMAPLSVGSTPPKRHSPASAAPADPGASLWPAAARDPF